MTLEYWRRSTLSALRTRTGTWAGLRAQPNLLGWAAIALAVALAAPFFLVDMPPVLDYPNHLARFMILAHPGDRALSAMYAPHWVLLPNLGADILGMLLLKIAPVHVGGRLVLAMALFAPVLGINLYSRAAFGRWTWWPLASVLAAYNGVFLMGFMSFLLSVGMAFAGAALWLKLRQKGHFWLSAAVGAVAIAAAFICHLFGVAVMALLIGAREGEDLIALWRVAGRPPYAEAARRAVLLAIALCPAMILFLSCGLAGAPSAPHQWDAGHKVWDLFTAFMSYSRLLTLLTGLFVFVVVILGWRGARFAPGARLALALGAVVYVLEPNAVQTGSFVDLRVGLILGCLLFAGVQPRVAPRDALVCGVVIAALIGGRVGDIALGWVHHRIDLADVRGAIAQVPQGARVLVAQGPGGGPAVAERLLPGVYATDGHVSALLAIERKAFWPLIFADPRQQPLAILPPYASLAAPLSEPVGWSALAKSRFSADDLAAVGNLNGWRQAFDYVLLVDAEGAGPPPAGLQPLYVGSYARLYRTPRRM